MIFVLHGADTYRSHQKWLQIKEKFMKDVDTSGLHIEQLSGETMTYEQFLQTTYAVGLFAQKRLIFIKDVLSKRKEKTLHDKLLSDLKTKNTENVIVFYEGADIASKKAKKETLASFLLKQPYVQHFAPLKGGQCIAWMNEYLSTKNISARHEALSVLQALVGEDLWALSHELDKLTSYALGKKETEITKEDVAKLVKGSIDANIFTFIDALSSQNPKMAFEELRKQYDNGAHELYILTMCLRQIRIMLEVKSAFEGRPFSQDIAKQLSYHPFVVKKTYASCKQFEMQTLIDAYQQLATLDQKAKSSSTDVKTALSLFIYHQTTKKRVSA